MAFEDMILQKLRRGRELPFRTGARAFRPDPAIRAPRRPSGSRASGAGVHVSGGTSARGNGLLTKAERQATQIIRKRRAQTGVVHNYKPLQQIMKHLPTALQKKLMRPAIRKGNQVMVKATKQQVSTHRSKTTGSREKWSAKVKAERAGAWDLYLGITHTVRTYKWTILGITGGRQGPKGDKKGTGNKLGWLEFGVSHWLWGNPPRYQEPPYGLMRKAGAASENQQRAAVEGHAKRWWRYV